MPDASEHSAYGSYDNNNNVDPMELGEEDEVEEVDGISRYVISETIPPFKGIATDEGKPNAKHLFLPALGDPPEDIL